jgi:Flp pilus assembly pilin Flp
MLQVVKNFLTDESGLETGEKAALLVLALIIAVGAITAIAPNIKSAFTTTGTTIDSAKNYTY